MVSDEAVRVDGGPEAAGRVEAKRVQRLCGVPELATADLSHGVQRQCPHPHLQRVTTRTQYTPIGPRDRVVENTKWREDYPNCGVGDEEREPIELPRYGPMNARPLQHLRHVHQAAFLEEARMSSWK